ncbi:MAG TPA: T9SS type B sorting domain-containing protein [Flavisolibacter sp.]|nr:T9SS type B sorting domain-containing protein [Flavisolibacter sp.]
MKPISVSSVITFVFAFLFCSFSEAQTFGISSSAVWISDCNQSNYFNTSGLIGPAGNVFTNNNLGTHTRNSGSLIFRGGEVRTYSTVGVSNVCGAKLHYRIYAQSGAPGAFNTIDLLFMEDCDVANGQYPSGGACVLGDQKWNMVIDDGTTIPYAPVDLTTFAPGNYVLEVYYDITGSSTSTSACDETIALNNGGFNYKANFSIQAPALASANPTTCNGSEGFITISGLTPGATYSVSYTDDGNPVGPNSLVANGSGQIIISGLNAGIYSDFELLINGCTTSLNTGLILSNPVIIPKFNKVAAFCAGTTAPTLPTTSLNGITGTWSPSVINNTVSGTYTFTPDAAQCGVSVTMNVTVTPRTTPTFSFGTVLTICSGGSVPLLPTTSQNGITGTWSPSSVSNVNSATYTFTPSGSQCANGTTFSVTVNPNITPTFTFGPSLSICAGNSVPSLPTTSDNGISGTWSPATVDNQNSGTYTFTSTAGQCATTTNFNVTVNPVVTPLFSFGPSLSICAGGSVPTLPTTSTNGISGTWSPVSVDNQVSGVYTFTPAAGACAPPVTFTVTVAPNITPTFSFGTALTICAGETVPALPNTSTNGITGTWSPSGVDNQNSGTYTFTPDAGQCATTASFTVAVNPNITPTFSFGTSLTICAGASVPSLMTTSNNGITGAWSPSAVDNQNSGTYTFTPTSGQCALPTTFTVTVNPIVTPVFSFGPALAICAGGSVPSLPTTSTNGINGTWSPTTVDNQNSGTYTFTPTGGQCANPTSLTVTVAPNITPTFAFGTSLSICNGGVVPSLPATSTNGITGTWSPTTVDNANSGTYTFTPDAGQCALSTNFVVTVNPILAPTFSFGTSMTICAGASVSTLPTTSTNGITGTWSPSAIDNQNSATYTFTPTVGQCATSASLTVTVSPNITPTFAFGTSLTICAGSSVPSLPAVSDNGINGTWSPAIVDNQNSDTYTFTPSAGQCAITASFIVTVNPIVTPTFSFGTSLSICSGGTVPTFLSTSLNGITGTWSPSVVDNLNSATYTFTPDAGQCATSTAFTVTVNAYVTPTFSIGSSITICQGSAVPSLPTISTNGITGTWSPSTVSNQTSNVYTFTANSGQCANPATFNVTVTPNTVPTFSFGTSLVICAGGTVPSLPTTSTNGLTGTWSPAIVSNQTSAVYTFTPDPQPGLCLTSTNFIVTVNQNVTPTFNFGPALTVCTGANVPALLTTSVNGITGTWSPATVSNQTSGTYTFTPTAGQCAANFIFNVTVTPVAAVDPEADTTVKDGAVIPSNTLSGTPAGVVFNWTNSNTSIGLPASGTGNIPSFTAINKGSSPIKGTITITPVYNGCPGAGRNYTVTVIPLDKDVFVPNVFTPNGDGKNDILYAYSNYIDKLEMRIFNQYGQQVQLITDPKKGWDGKYKGTPQPVGVYVYTVKATMTDGRVIQLSGNITLLR